MLENEFYKVIFNKEKNLLSVKLMGFWNEEELYNKIAKEFAVNLLKASPGWKMMIDLTELLTPPRRFIERIEEMQKRLRENGLRKIAEVLPKSAVAKLAIDRMLSEFGLEHRQFSNSIEALNWLES